MFSFKALFLSIAAISGLLFIIKLSTKKASELIDEIWEIQI